MLATMAKERYPRAVDRLRRIVTGVDETGRSRVVSDGPSPGRFVLPEARFDVLWRTDLPPETGHSTEPSDIDQYWMQPPSGTATWVMLDVPPGSAVPSGSASEIADSWSRFHDAGVYEAGGGGWHRTDSLDLVLVVEGEIVLELDDGAHKLTKGDCVVQTGTRHRWVNRSDAVCRLSGVIFGAMRREGDRR